MLEEFKNASQSVATINSEAEWSWTYLIYQMDLYIERCYS